MIAVNLTRELTDRLTSQPDRVELRDPQGRRIGYFVRDTDDDVLMWQEARNAFTDEEIAQAQAEAGTGVPLHELLAKLEAQWPSK